MQRKSRSRGSGCSLPVMVAALSVLIASGCETWLAHEGRVVIALRQGDCARARVLLRETEAMGAPAWRIRAVGKDVDAQCGGRALPPVQVADVWGGNEEGRAGSTRYAAAPIRPVRRTRRAVPRATPARSATVSGPTPTATAHEPGSTPTPTASPPITPRALPTLATTAAITIAESVTRVFFGEHRKLAIARRTGDGTSTAIVELANAGPRPQTVRWVGPSLGELRVAPGGRVAVELEPDSYLMTAATDREGEVPLAGRQVFTRGRFSLDLSEIGTDR